MATTTVSDAVVIPQAKGTGLGSEDDNVDAASAALLAEYSGGEYVASGMEFSGHDGTNDQVDITAGYCYIKDDSTSTSGSRGSGGNPQIQSTSSSGYETEIPNDQVYLVVFPTDVTNVDASDSTLNEVWINITDVTSNNAVEVRTSGGGGTTSEPSDTYLKLGEANPDDPSNVVVSNRGPDGRWQHITSTIDTDAGTTFDFDTGAISPIYDKYLVEGAIVSTSGQNESAHMQLGDSTSTSGTLVASGYEWIQISGGSGVGTIQGSSDFRIGSINNNDDREPLHFTIEITNPLAFNGSNACETGIALRSGGNAGGVQMTVRGELANEADYVDQIRLFGSDTSIAVAKISGRTYL